MRYVFPVALVAAVGLVSWSSPAEASLEACGNISVQANASCQVEVSGGCKSKCTPINFVTVCHTRRYNACRNECQLQPPSVDCQGGCATSCGADCSGSPGRVTCEADCKADCMGGCQSYCTEHQGGTSCQASCDATCSGDCSASCSAVPPSASCEASCEASCSGSCKVTAPYFECQTKCQQREYQECETQMQGGCETQCSKPEGALFCDGQFVDNGGRLEECVNALNKLLTGKVVVSGGSSLHCDADGVCTLTIGGSAGCAAAPGAVQDLLPTLLVLLTGALVVLRSRRRR